MKRRIKLTLIILCICRNLNHGLKVIKKTKKLTLNKKIFDENSIQVKITDNGIGIKKENLMKIFLMVLPQEKSHGFGLHLAFAAQELKDR